jgi:DNA-binding transcriptional LysR family regulator
MQGLNLDYLKAFVTVVEQGSFSAAAERLGLTQPAVSLQIRQLERKLNTTLIERVGRKARPTAAGAELLGHAESIEVAVSAAIEAVTRHASGTIGRVRLGTGATACIFLLPPLLGELRRKYPQLEITVITGTTDDIVRALEQNTIDVGLVTLPATSRALARTPFLEDEYCAVAPRTVAFPNQVSPASLRKLPLVLFEPNGSTRQVIDRWFAGADIVPRPLMSLGNVEAIKAMVVAGVGCSVLPGLAVGDGRHRGMVVRPLSPRLYRTLAVAIRRDKRLTRVLKVTVDALLALSGDKRA